MINSPSSMETQLMQVQKQSIATAIQYLCTNAETYYEGVRRAAHLAGARPEMFLLRAVFALDLTRIAVPRGGAIPLSSLPNAATEPPRLRRAVPQLFSGLEPSFQETLQRLVSTIDVHRQFVAWVTVEGEGMATHDMGRCVHAGAVIDALDRRPTWVGHLGGRMGSAGDNLIPPNQFTTTADGRMVPNFNAARQQQQQQQQQMQMQQNQQNSRQQQQQGFASPNGTTTTTTAAPMTYQDPFNNFTSPQQQAMYYQQQNQNPFQSMTPQQQKDQYQNVLSSIRSENNNNNNNNQPPQSSISSSSHHKSLPPNAAPQNRNATVSSSQYFSEVSSSNNNNNNTNTSNSFASPLNVSQGQSSNSANKPKPKITIPDTLSLEHLDKIDEYLTVSHMCTKASTKCLEHIQSFNVRLDELHNYTSSLSGKFDESRNVAKDLDSAVTLLMQKLQSSERQMLLLQSPKPITQLELKKKEEDEKALQEQKIRERAITEAAKLLKEMRSRGVEVGVQTEKSAEDSESDEKKKKKKDDPLDKLSQLLECPYCNESSSRFCKGSGRRHETPEEKAERRWKHLFRQMSLMNSFVSTARLSKANTCVSDGGIELVL